MASFAGVALAGPLCELSTSSSSYSSDDEPVSCSDFRAAPSLGVGTDFVLDNGSGYTHSRCPFLHPVSSKHNQPMYVV